MEMECTDLCLDFVKRFKRDNLQCFVFEFDISQSLVGTHEEVVIVHLFDTCNAAFQFIGHLMDLSGLCVVESDAVSAAEPNPVIAVHIAVADIDRCLGQFIYSVEHIVFLVVLKNATGFTYDP